MNVQIIEKNGIQYIKATNELGMEVIFSNLGATVVSIKIDGKAMTQSPLKKEDLKNPNIYYGKTIGQIANRIKDGIVEINGVKYQLDQNEGSNTLHGGKQGLSNQLFGIQRFKKNDSFTVIYSLTKNQNKGALPGKIDYFVAYSLSDNDNSLNLEFKAISDKDTVVALTNHLYFCLGESNLDRLLLEIHSDRFIDPDPSSLIPISEKDIIDCLNFNEKKAIIKDIDEKYLVSSKTKGYDHHLIFSDKHPIVLQSPDYKLEIISDFSGAQIYTDNYDDGIEMMNSSDKLRRGIAIEPQDSTLDRKILKKGEVYERHITYKFSKNQ